jgi:hypothetical protein
LVELTTEDERFFSLVILFEKDETKVVVNILGNVLLIFGEDNLN